MTISPDAPTPDVQDEAATLGKGLAAIVGPDHVLDAVSSRLFQSSDIFTEGDVAALVVQPGSAADLSACVALCTRRGFAVVPRGGGFSYTGGYVPGSGRSVMVDMRRMNRILAIDADDLYITVEAGCTWKQVYDALAPLGRRTPYFGPMSGYHSTVGGALSQGSFFLGSTQYGTTADSVLGLKVVLADGTLVQTGSAAALQGGSPFFRNYGPDLTGLFLHDAGALAFKAEVSLRLIPKPEHVRYASYAVADDLAAIGVMSAVARHGLASECYLWDAVFVDNVRKRGTVIEGLKTLGAIGRSGKSLGAGLRDAARAAIAGRSIFRQKASLLHVVIDEISEAAADAKLARVQALVEPLGPVSIEPTLPRASHGAPFNDFLPYETAHARERRLPTHALFAHSAAPRVMAEMRDYLEGQRGELAAMGIDWGCISFAVGSTAIAIEPCFYWDDERLAQHNRSTDTTDFARHAALTPPPARARVAQLRRDVVALFARHGGVHLQIGKDYPYREGIDGQTFALLESIKAAIDPQYLINPGSLGLRE